MKNKTIKNLRISIIQAVLCFLFLQSGSFWDSILKGQDFRQWAKTPPMGWNSWDCYGPTVTENEVKANADYMSSHLKDYGWEYIIVDIRWYIQNDKSHGYNEKDAVFCMDNFGRFVPAPNRFPSAADGNGFKSLADYVHAKGLKFGIHLMRGIPREAVYKNTAIQGTSFKAQDIFSKDTLCKWLGDMYSINYTKPGAQDYYNSVMNLYAGWGIDFIKIDDLSRPYHTQEISMIRKAIDQCGRQIVLSLSPGETPISEVRHVADHANMWRIIDDFWDKWPELKMHFALFEKWVPYMKLGNWPDGDMLPLGKIGIRAERGDNRFSLFNPDEQKTLMNLFAICRSPLFFGGDLTMNDSSTLRILTNRDITEINQHSKDNQLLFHEGNQIAWTAKNEENTISYLALFNEGDTPTEFTIPRKKLGVKKNALITEIWEMHPFLMKHNIKVKLSPHSSRLYKIE